MNTFLSLPALQEGNGAGALRTAAPLPRAVAAARAGRQPGVPAVPGHTYARKGKHDPGQPFPSVGRICTDSRRGLDHGVLLPLLFSLCFPRHLHFLPSPTRWFPGFSSLPYGNKNPARKPQPTRPTLSRAREMVGSPSPSGLVTSAGHKTILKQNFRHYHKANFAICVAPLGPRLGSPREHHRTLSEKKDTGRRKGLAEIPIVPAPQPSQG